MTLHLLLAQQLYQCPPQGKCLARIPIGKELVIAPLNQPGTPKFAIALNVDQYWSTEITWTTVFEGLKTMLIPFAEGRYEGVQVQFLKAFEKAFTIRIFEVDGEKEVGAGVGAGRGGAVTGATTVETS